MKLILMGIQGSGKSTQGVRLAKKFGLQYLSTGHIFRDMAQSKSRLGRYLKETMAAGLLIPDKKTIEIVEEYLARPEYKKGYIMDGFPRTIFQAEQFKHKLDLVIYLNVTDKEALWRISYRNDVLRDDETVIAVRKRIELFHKVTKPVLLFYRRRKMLVEVDGEQPKTKVAEEIMKQVAKIKVSKKNT